MCRGVKNTIRSIVPVLAVLFSICLPLGTASAKATSSSFGYGDAINSLDVAPDVPAVTSPAYGSTISSLTERLEWMPSVGAISYNVQLSTDFNFLNLILDQSGINNTYYDLQSLNKNSFYYWRVRANGQSSVSAWSSTGYFKTAFSFVPNAPDNLQATRVSPGRIDLSWNDESDNEIRFVIERRTGQSPYSQINIVVSNTTLYSDTSAADGTVYYYRIKATGLAGDSNYSNEALIDLSFAPNPPSASIITWPGQSYMIFTLEPRFQWQPSDGAVSYTIEISSDADFSNIVYIQDGISTNFLDLPPEILDWYHSYVWRVSAQDIYGNSSGWSTSGSFSVEPTDQVPDQNRCSCVG